MDINMSINEILQDKQHVWVLFDDESDKKDGLEKGKKSSFPVKKSTVK